MYQNVFPQFTYLILYSCSSMFELYGISMIERIYKICPNLYMRIYLISPVFMIHAKSFTQSMLLFICGNKCKLMVVWHTAGEHLSSTYLFVSLFLNLFLVACLQLKVVCENLKNSRMVPLVCVNKSAFGGVFCDKHAPKKFVILAVYSPMNNQFWMAFSTNSFWTVIVKNLI